MPADSDIELFWAINRPKADGETVGGAIDNSGNGGIPGWRPMPDQLTVNGDIELSADGPDTGDVDVEYRTATGQIATTTVTLDGTNWVPAGITGERLLLVGRQAFDANRIVTVRRAGGADLFTIPAGEIGRQIMGYAQASQASPVTREEKLFVRNKAADDLNDAVVTLSADPAAIARIGVAATKDDSGSIADRLANSFGVSFFDDGVAVAVPTDVLGAGEAIGVIAEFSLSAAHAPVKNSITIEGSGTSIT